MKREVLYHYIGTNGTILSPVHLEDAYYIRKIRLVADEGKRLTKNGEKYVTSVTIPEEDEENWREVGQI